MTGWEREIIDPIDALIAPRELRWKEKWGLIRVEWVAALGGGRLEPPVGLDIILEAASSHCCAECGRWHGWMQPGETDYAVVTTATTRGWVMTLCQHCRARLDAEQP